MSAWVPLSPHVSQLRLNPDGTYAGNDDCGPACAVRYLREMGRLDIRGDRLAQFDEFRRYTQGQPDQQFQGGTSVSDVEAYIGHHGVAGGWTNSFDTARNSPFAVCLIDAPPRLTDGGWPYDESWLGGFQHWILWLPVLADAEDYFNDPLSYFTGETDTHLDLGYLRGIFSGAIVLPGPVPPEPRHPLPAHITAPCALKVRPDHACTALAHLTPGNRCLLLPEGARVADGTAWNKVEWSGRTGFVPTANVKTP